MWPWRSSGPMSAKAARRPGQSRPSALPRGAGEQDHLDRHRRRPGASPELQPAQLAGAAEAEEGPQVGLQVQGGAGREVQHHRGAGDRQRLDPLQARDEGGAEALVGGTVTITR